MIGQMNGTTLKMLILIQSLQPETLNMTRERVFFSMMLCQASCLNSFVRLWIFSAFSFVLGQRNADWFEMS